MRPLGPAGTPGRHAGYMYVGEDETVIDIHKPKALYPNTNGMFNYTFGGLQSYHDEIAILSANGYTHSEHLVHDRDGQPMIVGALHRAGKLVKVYEL